MAAIHISGNFIYLLQRQKWHTISLWPLVSHWNIHDHHIPVISFINICLIHSAICISAIFDCLPLLSATSDLLIERLTNSPSQLIPKTMIIPIPPHNFSFRRTCTKILPSTVLRFSQFFCQYFFVLSMFSNSTGHYY